MLDGPELDRLGIDSILGPQNRAAGQLSAEALEKNNEEDGS